MSDDVQQVTQVIADGVGCHFFEALYTGTEAGLLPENGSF